MQRIFEFIINDTDNPLLALIYDGLVSTESCSLYIDEIMFHLHNIKKRSAGTILSENLILSDRILVIIRHIAWLIVMN